MRAAALIPLLALCACAPKAPPRPQAVQLDCDQTFEAMSAKILAQANIDPKPKDPTDNFRVYSVDQGRASYVITDRQAPAHPAILMQQVAGPGAMKDSGCSWGDKAAYDELVAYFAALKSAHK